MLFKWFFKFFPKTYDLKYFSSSKYLTLWRYALKVFSECSDSNCDCSMPLAFLDMTCLVFIFFYDAQIVIFQIHFFQNMKMSTLWWGDVSLFKLLSADAYVASHPDSIAQFFLIFCQMWPLNAILWLKFFLISIYLYLYYI